MCMWRTELFVAGAIHSSIISRIKLLDCWFHKPCSDSFKL